MILGNGGACARYRNHLEARTVWTASALGSPGGVTTASMFVALPCLSSSRVHRAHRYNRSSGHSASGYIDLAITIREDVVLHAWVKGARTYSCPNVARKRIVMKKQKTTIMITSRCVHRYEGLARCSM